MSPLSPALVTQAPHALYAVVVASAVAAASLALTRRVDASLVSY